MRYFQLSHSVINVRDTTPYFTNIITHTIVITSSPLIRNVMQISLKALGGKAVVLSALLAPVASHAQLCMNEICQSNIHLVFDAQEFPDSWVELHNTTATPVNLKGWRIGLTADASSADVLSADTIVAPNGHILIHCDKSDEGEPAPLHTTFRIDSGKGSVYLFTPQGTQADMVSLKKMIAPEITYGRTPDGSDKWAYQVTPTPGSKNQGATSSEALPSPEYSVPGGVFNETVNLTISAPAGVTMPDDAILCVTTDGREPRLQDKVSGLTHTLAIEKTTSVRAKFVSAKMLNPLSVTHSYIFDKTAMPVLSITTDPDYLYSESIGILHGVYGQNPNYGYDWRRPINVELYMPGKNGHEMLFNQLGETRVKGNSTRGLPQKSMIVYGNKRFGVKRFDTTGLWPDKPNVTIAKSFEIKNSGADFDRAHMRDPLVNLVIGRNNPNVDWQAFNAAITYFNGEFIGIYEVRERTNEDFIEANYNGLEDIDMVENWNEVKAGTIDATMQLYNLLHTSTPSYEKLAELIDMDNYLPPFAVNIFGANYDSGGGNNTVMWRNLEEDGAKWRNVIKDVDLWGGTWDASNEDYDMFSKFIFWDKYANEINNFRSRILSAYLMTDSVAAIHLVDHIVAATGDYLQPEYFNSVADEIHDYYKDDYGRYLNKYYPWGEATMVRLWENKIQNLKDFVVKRRPILFAQMSQRYGLGHSFNLDIDHSTTPLSINGVDVYRPEFDGLYFTGRPLVLEAPSIKYWEVSVTDTLGVTHREQYVGDRITLKAKDNTQSYRIYVDENMDSINGIHDVSSDYITQLHLTVDGLTITAHSGTDITGLEAFDSTGRIVARSTTDNLILPSRGMYIIRAVNRKDEILNSKVVL